MPVLRHGHVLVLGRREAQLDVARRRGQARAVRRLRRRRQAAVGLVAGGDAVELVVHVQRRQARVAAQVVHQDHRVALAGGLVGARGRPARGRVGGHAAGCGDGGRQRRARRARPPEAPAALVADAVRVRVERGRAGAVDDDVVVVLAVAAGARLVVAEDAGEQADEQRLAARQAGADEAYVGFERQDDVVPHAVPVRVFRLEPDGKKPHAEDAGDADSVGAQKKKCLSGNGVFEAVESMRYKWGKEMI